MFYSNSAIICCLTHSYTVSIHVLLYHFRYDELLVGAPFYSISSPENGRVYVYCNNNVSNHRQ